MKYLDKTFPTPWQNLACDEALLDLCEEGQSDEILRFWEPEEHFVVLGYSNKIHEEVNLLFCEGQNIPVLRRCSGGGTILQGPGCLNFSLFLKIERTPELKSLLKTNAFILKQNQAALSKALGKTIDIQGTSDLTCGSLKFSGNAQRRHRHFLLFHGTFLLNMDIQLIEQTLKTPPRQPDYRQNRPHQTFLTNLNLPAETLKKALRSHWEAQTPITELPETRIANLVKTHYLNQAWNLKF